MIDPKKTNKIPLYKDQEFVGELVRTVAGCDLNFDQNFFKKHLGKKISYHLPVSSPKITFSGAGLPPYFAGLLPEGLRLTSLIKNIKTSADDMFSLLVAAGTDPVGDIYFGETELPDDDSPLPDDFKKIKTQLKNPDYQEQTPLAGVQDKISADRVSLPLKLKAKTKTYFLKLPSENHPYDIENEHCCLEIAKACGLKVNPSQIVKDRNNISGLLVERFDRGWNSRTQKWTRYHQEDACQFLNRYPADKYNVSFQEIAQQIKQFANSPEIEILKLLQLKAFCYLIGNGDLHAKNISLLKDQLSPAYDILCTALYGDEKMALELDGKSQNLKRKNFIEFGLRFGVPEPAIKSMLNKMLFQFSKNQEKIFALPNAKQKEKFLLAFFSKRAGHLR
jgi:serine/threonine-protein kinase HipA